MYDDNQQTDYNASQQNNTSHQDSANQTAYQPPPPQYQQPQYQPPPPTQPYNNPQLWPPMKIGDWAVVWLISLIPIANLVMMFVWGLSSDVNPSKKAYFQWQLIMTAVSIVFFIILFVFAGAFIVTLLTTLVNAI